MSTRIRSLSVVAALTLALTSLPVTSLASPISTPAAASSQVAVQDSNPLRTMLYLVGQESTDLWLALTGAYSGSYIASACDQPC